ncbi:MAG: undecaprenyl-diphosphatase [Sphingomonas hengshuiensis]|uniref:Undecaprenyl-diphosphatase n=1 Tax=Sphingomonas hengshuiensis TaxID=1609977 RepID=A0A2W5AVE0_9SPHN|nr:MAG: undecaprenyl-diphosphatase [Sphingomonas hengshuiensis]
MAWLEAAILGIIQGLTEFLPVSSSAHLRIAGAFLPSHTDPGAAFTAIIQIGTEAAVLLYFRNDIWRIATAWLGQFAGGQDNAARDNARLGWLVIIGTLPIVVLGLLFKDAIETSLRNLWFTAFSLIGFGILLGIADVMGRRRWGIDRLRWGSGIVFGFAQAMALLPGVSRSGGTITAGLFMGFTREAAARYSFLLAIPAVLASGLYQLLKTWGEFGPYGPGPTLLATAISFVVGYVSIVGFLKLVSTRGYMAFVVYRVLLGGTLIYLLSQGRIAALA